MTQHRHTIPKGANQTASVTDPDLSPYAKTTALQAEAASRLAADAALGNRVSTLEASMANVLLRLAAVEAHFTPPAPPSRPWAAPVTTNTVSVPGTIDATGALVFAHVDGLTITGNTQPLSSGSLAVFTDCSGVVGP